MNPSRRSLLSMLLALAAVASVAPIAHAQAPDRKPMAVVTGANRGLGLEFAKQLTAAGWDVVGTARRPEAATDLKATGARVLALDVTIAESVARLAKALEGRAVDLVINNAGIGNRTATVAEMKFDEVERIFAVNALGPMRLTQALLPNLRAGDRKLIVNISSGLGSIQNNTSGRYLGYRESKAALNMFTRTLAVELKPQGFTCIAMSPGWVQTDMGGSEAPLTPEVSIRGMRKVIDALKPEDTGKFFSHDGSTLPW